ncbi:hypothetical protein C6560_17760 [Enterobacter sp. FS01]|uniref:hypothetical protein n=1 Tax=Atlantibacter hermannii TaxID=565 RepID=UPI000D12318C|nr:hypothetical protein [Atlantibacter hermannii]PSS47386.1 hypothetical protein C6560_17760 [Enterobacter sp. FS01]
MSVTDSPENRALLQAIQNDWRTWSGSEQSGIYSRYFSGAMILAGALLVFLAELSANQKMLFIFGLIELLVGLAAFAMVFLSSTDWPVVIGKKLKVYRPHDTGAYHRLCMAMLVAGKLQQDDLRAWLDAETSAGSAIEVEQVRGELC